MSVWGGSVSPGPTVPVEGQDKHFEQTFSNVTQVVVNHNFGKLASVTVLDATGQEIWADEKNATLNSVTVEFTKPETGKIICN